MKYTHETIRPFLFSLLLLACLPAGADGNDFGLDFTAEANKKLLDNRLTLGVAANMRTQDNTSQMERYLLEVGGTYKLVDRKKYSLKVGLSYEHMWTKSLDEYTPKNSVKYYSDKFDYIGYGQFQAIEKGYNTGYNYDASYWRRRSRINLSASFSYKPAKRFTLTLKETLQYRHYSSASTERTKYRHKVRYYEDDSDTLYTTIKEKESKDRWMLRSKLSLQYSRKRCPWEPYISAEYGCGLGYNAHKWKFTAGTDYKISKQHSIGAFYRFQTENDDDEPNGHIIGLGYSFKF